MAFAWNSLTHGALQAFFAVALGAFGAHGLAERLGDYGTKIWQTAASYHLAHALALVALGVFERQRGATLPWVQTGFGLGILFFSGSLYVLAVSGQKWFGAITPLGGLCFLAAWLGLAYVASRA